MAVEECLRDTSGVEPYRREWHYARALQHLYQDGKLHGDIAIIAAVLLWMNAMTIKRTFAAMTHGKGFLELTAAKKRRKLALNQDTTLETEVLRSMVAWGHYQTPEIAELPDQSIMAAIRERVKSPNYVDAVDGQCMVYDEYRLFMYATARVRERNYSRDEPPHILYFDEMYDFVDKWYQYFATRPETTNFDQQLLSYYHWLSKFILDGQKPGCLLVEDDDFDTLEPIDNALHWLETVNIRNLSLEMSSILPMNTIAAEIERRRPTAEVHDRMTEIFRRAERMEGMWNTFVLADLADMTATLRDARPDLFPKWFHTHKPYISTDVTQKSSRHVSELEA